MDPVLKMMMFQHWVEDQREMMELAKNHAYLMGSFWDPEAVSKLMGSSVPAYASSDEDFEKSLDMVRKEKLQEVAEKTEKPVRRKRRVKQ